MKVVVLGLGYVGSVCAGCLARDGFDVVGIDVNDSKVRRVQSGKSPVLEPELDDLIGEGVRSGRLRAAAGLDEDSKQADIFLVCVGTPSAKNGSSNLSHLVRALEQLGDALKGLTDFQVVTIRSTVPPGTLREKVIPILEARSLRKVGESLGAAMNPEFLREGTSIRDYDTAAFDLCGVTDPRTSDAMQKLYASKGRPFQATTLETAEMVKYVNNAFHALKVSFANEIGRLAHSSGVDSLEVMRLLCEDKRLNISPAYLRPGMAFGGSCLPKDLRALVYESKRRDVAAPLLESILSSNEVHQHAALSKILSYGRLRTAVLGLSFKAGTDDLRESAMVLLVEGLLGKGVPVKIYDRNVRLSSLVGANRDYIEKEVPHIGSLLVESLPDALRDAEVVVVGTDDPEMDQVPGMLLGGQVLVDLFGRLAADGGVRPEGICW
ncbi:MAG TPA: nucleotide sugar dehydrogenase [Candidatus Polarisedimenticolia bacterium]|nr:nucleotide sugar dehydrogenase [Candidatus Polarisedimenticolia bacterium]